MTRRRSQPAPAVVPPGPAVDCVVCQRPGRWAAGAAAVVHQTRAGVVWSCELPPRDADRLTERQRRALDGAIAAAHAERAAQAAAA